MPSRYRLAYWQKSSVSTGVRPPANVISNGACELARSSCESGDQLPESSRRASEYPKQRPCAEKWRDHLIRQVFGIVKTIGIQFLYDQLSKVAAIEIRIERKRV